MFRRIPLAAAVALAFAMPAWAQDAGQQAPEKEKNKDARTLETVTVTAQKREENLQKVPISLQVLGSTQLEQQNVLSFRDYANLIPSLSYGTAGGGVFSGPGFVQVYMRGVASGGDGNHSGSQPSVGMYLDEQPITTIQGSLDIHMYDIDRVEALAGPQGTLYGASSQAGTVRIITKKPDPSGYAAGFSVEANAIDGGGFGHVLEGFVNLPVNNNTAAVRLVGWQKHDAGWVDNLLGTRTYPTSGIVASNAAFAKNNYNTADTAGVRASARFNIADRWTITPQLIAQKMKAHGSAGIDPLVGSASAGYDSSFGRTAVKHFNPEFSDDRWYQAAMTVEGKVGNFDLTYVFSHLKRDVDSAADYSDYGYWYDALAGYGAYFYDDSGNLINPAQHISAKDGYKRTSHELRVASPQDNRLRLVAGLFWQTQSHAILQNYQIDGLASVLSVSGWPDTIWLTRQDRTDTDHALFGQLSYDLTDRLEMNVGGRWFRAHNTLKGFFGFANGYSSQSSTPP
ncbi:MAG: TonB-dependent receptor, partial [Thermomonas hydrothermalis]